jgi:hypothetical protein
MVFGLNPRNWGPVFLIHGAQASQEVKWAASGDGCLLSTCRRSDRAFFVVQDVQGRSRFGKEDEDSTDVGGIIRVRL